MLNLLELKSLISRVTREGTQALGLLVLVDLRVVWGAVSKGRSSSRKINFLLRKLGFWCLACDIALELVWVQTWNESSIPNHKLDTTIWLSTTSASQKLRTTDLCSRRLASRSIAFAVW